MRLILHIGTAKTGTSTLQWTLRAHAEVLDRAGVLYPVPKFKRANHNFIASLLLPPEKMPREFTSESRGDIDVIRRRGREFWDDIRDQVRRSKADVAVISGEYFFGLPYDQVVGFRELLAEVFDEIVVVAYVRDPASYYVSLAQQVVKASHEINMPAQALMLAKARLCRYREVFGGAARLMVRSSARSDLHEGCIVRDFMRSYVPNGEVISKEIDVIDKNESMSAEAMCILQRFRKAAWPHDNGRFAPESDLVVRILNDHRSEWGQSRARLRPSINAAVLHKHREDLEWLEDQYGIVFDGVVRSSERPRVDRELWRSNDLEQILDVDPDVVDSVLFELLREIASRAGSAIAAG